jgi:hypothetical protein
MARDQEITLVSVDRRLDDFIEVSQEHRKRLESQIAQILGCLQDNGKPGLTTRVDRLEQVEAKRAWHIRTVWAAMVAGFITFIAKG